MLSNQKFLGRSVDVGQLWIPKPWNGFPFLLQDGNRGGSNMKVMWDYVKE